MLLVSCRTQPTAQIPPSIPLDAFLARQGRVTLAERAPDGDAVRIAYTEIGPPDGLPVVLLHGVPTSSWMYQSVLDRLAASELRVIALDNVGFGSSSKPAMSAEEATAFFAPARQAHRLGMALDAVGVGPAIFVVHDVGGAYLWELLMEEPHRAAGLVVLNTVGAPGGFAPPAAMDNPLVQAGMRVVGFERDESIRSIICGMVADPTRIDSPDRLEGYYRPFRDGAELPYYTFLTNLDQIRDRTPAYSRLIAGLRVPAALVWGAHDENLLAVPSAAWFAGALGVPAARSIVVEDAKHLVAEEAPELVTSLILQVAADVAER